MDDGRFRNQTNSNDSNNIKPFQIAKKILSEILKGFGFNLY
jgi:hypothetical protein